MNKKLIALAVAGALAAPMAAQAEGVSVSGFADIFWTITDESADTGTPVYNPAEGQFTVPETEVDFMGSGVRVDLDNVNGSGDINVEQANFTYDFGNGWAVMGGTFNSGITADAQDAPDMQTSNNSLPFATLSAVGAANLSGLAVSGMAGPANVTVLYVNDPSNDGVSDGENSIGLKVSGSVMEGLDLELGFLPQDKGVGNLTDFNAMYTMGGLGIGLDYLQADPQSGSGDVDTVSSIIVGYDFGNGFGVKGRADTLTYEDNTDDLTQNSIFVSYAANDNLTVALDSTTVDGGVLTDSQTKTTVEMIATF